jgi:hypothetical protein
MAHNVSSLTYHRLLTIADSWLGGGFYVGYLIAQFPMGYLLGRSIPSRTSPRCLLSHLGPRCTVIDASDKLWVRSSCAYRLGHDGGRGHAGSKP